MTKGPGAGPMSAACTAYLWVTGGCVRVAFVVSVP
jgi:hypothetical protein